MSNFSKRILPVVTLILSLLSIGCTANDLDKYRDNGLVPGEESTIAVVVQKAKVATKKRDEESVGDAFDELADFFITTSPIWLPIVQSSINN